MTEDPKKWLSETELTQKELMQALESVFDYHNENLTVKELRSLLMKSFCAHGFARLTWQLNPDKSAIPYKIHCICGKSWRILEVEKE